MGIRKEVLCDIFVDLHKDNDALDWGNALDIMEVYGVVLQVFHLLTHYWYNETMVERARGYYRDPFQGFWGVTHGWPTVPPYLQFCGRRDYLSLGWSHGGKCGRP